MTDGAAGHTVPPSVRQIIEQQGTCVAAGTGPNGEIGGILIFGPPGLVQVADDGLCRFPLQAIAESSSLRAWLRISRHTGQAVPWALLFVDRTNGASALLVGTARLAPGAEGPDMDRTASLMVEVEPAHATSQPNRAVPAEASVPPRATTSAADLSTLRTLAERPANELTAPVRSFLETCTEAFLCSYDEDARPRIQYFGAAPGNALIPGPDIAFDEQTFYARVVGDEAGAATEGGASPPDGALLIAPNYQSKLAVRVTGTAQRVGISAVPPQVQTALKEATDVLQIAVTRVDVQAGDWSTSGETAEQNDNIRVAQSVLRVHGARSVGRPEVSFIGGPTVLARGGESLLELAEANGVPMEAGCRMGICGADPVRIDIGLENLSRIRRSEQSTLDRMGLPPGCRMACSARVQGPVTVAPTVEAADEDVTEVGSTPISAPFPLDPEVRRVVVIGTGIAGITAVEEVRKLHPNVEITVIGTERYDFYNRMAISRLVDEDTTPDKLSLMSADWARRRRVLYLPGVSAAAINRERREVIPDEGVSLPYDRLVLAMGARSRIPAIEGIDLPGTFALRTVDDALEVRRHVHRPGLRRAVIIGGGLLGLEAAYHLVQAGLRVWIVGRGEWPADRQLDEHAGALLSQMLQDLGIEYIPNSEPRRLLGRDAIERVELMDGHVLEVGLCLLAAGIVPEIDLAREAGLEVVQGVVVNDHMMTSDEAIYAAGDVIEYGGRTFGLWPASVDQAVVAGTNLLGGDLPYHATMAPAQLKVPGIDLLSVGEIAPRGPEEREIRITDRHARHYRKLVLHQGHAIGAIAIGSPTLFDGIIDAVQTSRDLSAQLTAIERGDWSVLASEDEEVADDALTVSSVG
jgi:NADPH-dependent 2,4-dienoyl-CoA reductase/sulfur reductase-like enzyme/ferredoxin